MWEGPQCPDGCGIKLQITIDFIREDGDKRTHSQTKTLGANRTAKPQNTCPPKPCAKVEPKKTKPSENKTVGAVHLNRLGD